MQFILNQTRGISSFQNDTGGYFFPSCKIAAAGGVIRQVGGGAGDNALRLGQVGGRVEVTEKLLPW